MTMTQAFGGLLALLALAALLAALDPRSGAPSPDLAVEAKRVKICADWGHGQIANECLTYLRLNNLP